MNWETDWLEGRSRLTPEKIAVVNAETRECWTYRQLNQRALRIATSLGKLGIAKGERVAILAPNDISYFDLLFACGKLGAIFVPLNWRLSPAELAYIIKDCQPSLLAFHDKTEELSKAFDVREKIKVHGDRYESWISENVKHIDFPNIKAKDPWAILYTGGTTGKPKGVVLSHQSMNWNALNTIVSWNLTAEDVTLTYLPMFHTGGLNALTLPILQMGGKVVLGQKFDPDEAIRLLNQERCTIALMVPTMYHLLVQSPEFEKAEFPSMKTFLSGGASCPHAIYEAFEKKGIAFKEGYGLTEAGPNNFFIDPKEARKKHGSVGRPMMLNSVKVVDESGAETSVGETGELCIQGHHVFDHYWNNLEATKKIFINGWLQTGDLAKRDEEGDYYILGRKNEMIITGGENVFPLEVENVIIEHEMVSEVAVVGLPDEKWGEIVTALIVLKDERVPEIAELRNHCLKSLGKYKIPKKWFFVKELPKTDVGKIDKKAIVEEYSMIKG